MRPEPGVRLTLIARDVVTPYSGMLPGQIAGHYDLSESHIDLQPLSRFARARLYHTRATGLDLENRLVRVEGRPPVPFDLLSIDVGSTPSQVGIEGAEKALAVKPVDHFLDGWRDLEAAIVQGSGPFRLVIIGGGAAGTELSLCLQYRLRRALQAVGGTPDRVEITVITDTDEPLASHAPKVRQAMRRFLDSRDIHLQAGKRAIAVEETAVRLDSGEALPFDAAVLATHAAAHAWPGDSGLAVDDAGFIKISETLESLSHPGIFATGDIAALAGATLPKSGVYAVRQGPILAENLRRAALGDRLRPYRPQKRTLALISSGDRYAVASYGDLTFEGDWVWRFKDWIDRRWMRQYQDLPDMAPGEGDAKDDAAAVAMRCGGCGAKVTSAILRRVLDRLRQGPHAEVVVGLENPDDAAVIAPPAGKVLLQTVDHFRAFIDDPFLFGRITVNHCLGDIYAMGAVPRSALAMVSLPYGPEAKVEADLDLLLQGAVAELAKAKVELLGGHTGEAAELAFGLTVNGEADADALLRKGGAQPGDVLVLTKPLGTGAIFAADMRGEASADWVDGAIETMLLSNGPASQCFAQHGATSATDITGFGLLGHLVEMLNASRSRAEIEAKVIPALRGATELIASGIVSSLQAGNEAFAESLNGAAVDDPGLHGLLFDPQTAGGLLASVPPGNAEACLAMLKTLGYSRATPIGLVLQANANAPLISLKT